MAGQQLLPCSGNNCLAASTAAAAVICALRSLACDQHPECIVVLTSSWHVGAWRGLGATCQQPPGIAARRNSRSYVPSGSNGLGTRIFVIPLLLPPQNTQGCINNTTAGRQTVTFKFPGAIVPPSSSAAGYEVHVCGSFTDWQVSIPLTSGADGDYYAKVALTVSVDVCVCVGGGGRRRGL